MTKIEIATQILNGICAGDWKFDVKDKTWDEVAVDRSLEIAELLLKKYHGIEEV